MSEESPNTRISPQTQPSLHEQIADAVRTVRETTPLAQSFTNFVTINLSPTRSSPPAARRP